MTFVKLLRFSLVWQALSEGLVCQTSFSSKPPNSRIVSMCAEAPVFKDYLVFTQMRARDLFRGRYRDIARSGRQPATYFHPFVERERHLVDRPNPYWIPGGGWTFFFFFFFFSFSLFHFSNSTFPILLVCARVV